MNGFDIFFTSLKSHSSFYFLGNVTGFQIFHIVCCSAYFVLTRCASPEEFHENNLFATKSSRHGSVGRASASTGHDRSWFRAPPMPVLSYVQENGSAAMLDTKRSAGAAP